MEFSEIKAYLETNADNDEVKQYLAELSKPTIDRVEDFLESEDGKKLLQPKMDSYYSKGLDTWKKNNLEKELDREIKKRFPAKDEKDIELERMRAEFEKMKAEADKEKLRSKALKIATDKKLPSDIVDYFIGDDEDSTVNNLEKVNKIFSQYIQKAVEDKLKDGSYTPPGSKKDQTDNDLDAFMKGLGLNK